MCVFFKNKKEKKEKKYEVSNRYEYIIILCPFKIKIPISWTTYI